MWDEEIEMRQSRRACRGPGFWERDERWNEGLGWCLTTRRPGKREMRESPKLAEKLENVKIVPSHSISVSCFEIL